MPGFDPDHLDARYLFREWDDMPNLEQKALQLCKGTVLDCGAGAGTHSLILEQKGIPCKSIDISQGAVDTMKIRGVQNTDCTSVLDVSGSFDTILFLMNGIGMAESLSGLDVLLDKLKSLLNKGGQVLLDSSDMIYLFDGDVPELDSYYGELEYRLRYEDQDSGWFKWLYIDFEALRSVCLNKGFHCTLLEEGPHFDYLAQLQLID